MDDGGQWPRLYNELAAILRDALAAYAVAIEHIGSTAVPGLVAKPILDIAIGLPRSVRSKDLVEVLSQLGLIFRGDKGAQGGVLLVSEDGPWHRTAHIHVVEQVDPQWQRYLDVRDRLRSDPTARDAYAALKRRLAQRFPYDRASYTSGKAAFITELLGRSRTDAHGIGPRLVPRDEVVQQTQ